MWFHPKENSEGAAGRWGSPGGTQPTQHPQPCHHCGHFPNPLSQELPCSHPPDPSALREYDSSLHMPKYHHWPWDWGICPHSRPKRRAQGHSHQQDCGMAPTSRARRMSWSNAGAGKHQHQPNLHSIPFIPVPRAIPSEGEPAPWGRGTHSWLLLMYHYHHPAGHREEQHWPHSMPWLTPLSSQDTTGLQGGTQKIWEHIKGFPKTEPIISMPESSLFPPGTPMVPRVDAAARGSQVTFHPSFRALGSSLSSAAPISHPRCQQGCSGVLALEPAKPWPFSPWPPVAEWQEGAGEQSPAQSSAQQGTAKGWRGAGKGDKRLFLAAIESFKYAH